MIELTGCAIVENGKLLLLWKKKHSHYEFPGGKLEANESLEEGAVREVKEELGVNVEIKKYLGYKEFVIDGKEYRSHKFLAKIKKGEVPRIVEIDKFERLFWLPIAEHENFILAPNARAFCKDIVDGTLKFD